MDLQHLNCLLSKGYSTAAQFSGAPYKIMRPQGGHDPVNQQRLVASILVSFPDDGSSDTTFGHFRKAVYDTSVALLGDYLVAADGSLIYFVASAQIFSLPECALANDIVSIFRAPEPTVAGYGFLATADWWAVIDGWPARVLVLSSHGAELNTVASRLASWTIELPSLPCAILISDVVRDSAGRSFIVMAVEETRFGVRIFVHEVGG
jgi:hypothetical protein